MLGINFKNILKDKTLVFIDLETTGLNPEIHKVIEIGAVKVLNGKVIDEFSELVNPGVEIPRYILLLTGINKEDIAVADSVETVIPKFKSFMKNSICIAHNAKEFEIKFLNYLLGNKMDNKFIDSLELSCLLLPTLRNYKLENLLQHFEIKDKETHRGLADAKDLLKVWKKLFESIDAKDKTRIEAICNFMKDVEWEYNEIFIDIKDQLVKLLPKRKEYMSYDEKSIEPKRDGFVYNPVKNITLEVEKITSFFTDNGPLSRKMASFEKREEQRDMAKAVTEAFNEDQILLIEAGTGVGKSFGYLVPSFYWCEANKTKVIISTNTKNLQDQLYLKDAPFIQKCLDSNFKVSLIKGRENYICLRKWFNIRNELASHKKPSTLVLTSFGETEYSIERKAAVYIISWVYSTKTGDLDEFSGWYRTQYPLLDIFKKDIYAEAESCLWKECPFYKQCLYRRIIKLSNESDIIITNHALLLSPPNWFPQYHHLVIDEAHNLEDSATEAYTKEVSENSINYILNRLYNSKTKQGQIFSIFVRIIQNNPNKSKNKEITDFKERAISLLAEIKTKILPDFSTRISDFISTFRRKPLDELTSDLDSAEFAPLYDTKLELVFLEKFTRQKDLLSTWNTLIYKLTELKKIFIDITDYIQINYSTIENIVIKELLLDINAISDKIKTERDILEFILARNEDNFVYYVTKREFETININKTSESWILKASPIDVSLYLKENLYTRLSAIIMTSATLSVNKEFSFFLQRLGLDNLDVTNVETKLIGSPFRYHEQVVLGIPADTPTFDRNRQGDFIDSVSNNILNIAIKFRGKILVLFNSLWRMNRVFENISPELENNNILCLCQGSNISKTSLVEILRDSTEDIIALGSKSLREGIDVPGLRGIIIEKIPFISPDDPLTEARNEHMQSLGQNAFFDYQVPLASINLRQAFGRLVRSKEDVGVVIILDNRLANFQRRYGQYILESLPSCKIFIKSSVELYDQLENYYKQLKNKIV